MRYAARLLCTVLSLSTMPAAAETVCAWGKQAEVVSRMPSGRPGYDAVYLRWQDGHKSFVLEPKGSRPDCRIPMMR